MQFEVWVKETASLTGFYSIPISAMSRHQAHQQAADAGKHQCQTQPGVQFILTGYTQYAL